MNNLIIEDEFAPTSISEIETFEQKISAKLPNDYFEFLVKYNGGRFKQNAYDHMLEPVTENVTGIGLEWFYTLAESKCDNLVHNYTLYSKRIPKELIPIGDDGGSNQICVCIKGKNYGKIYYWNHDWEHNDGEELTYRNVYLITNTFIDFVNGLYQLVLEDDGSWTKRYQDGSVFVTQNP